MRLADHIVDITMVANLSGVTAIAQESFRFWQTLILKERYFPVRRRSTIEGVPSTVHE
jgi:hypothetical protein